MKKAILICILCFFLIGSLLAPLSSQTLDDILKEMIQAQGGKAAIEKIKDMKVTGTIEVPQQELSVSFTQYKKEPDKRRIEMKVMNTVQVQGFDGKTAWELNPQTGNAMEIPGEDAIDIKRGSLALGWILDLEKYGISLVHKGREKIDGKYYIVIEQVYSDGGKVVNYVDPETYLIFKIKSKMLDEMMVEVETETFLSDYKSIQGYVMAHTMISYLREKEYMRVIYKKVKLNTGLPHHLFSLQK
jgi:outer membrane lipoprotein-sorting protein